MIDRICYWILSKIDEVFQKLEDAFITFPDDEKKKKK